MRKIHIALVLGALLVAGVGAGAGLSGCAATAVGAGASVGSAAAEERGFKNAAADTRMQAEINKLYLEQGFDLFRRMTVKVSEGRVMLTGPVVNPDTRIEAVRLAWQVDGVREVINEIEVSNHAGFSDYARDGWIVTQLKAKLLFDEQVSAINYSIDAVNGVVYLMGIAQNQAEIDRVIEHARGLKYVRKVISHVRLKNDPRRSS